jgi:NMD protein affecting ribosome stability and mRNA decay
VNTDTKMQRTGRRISGRAQQDHILDPYQAKQKPQEGTACPQCGSAYHQGRWQWGEKLEHPHNALCPACRRVNDDFPAGIVTLHGDWVGPHKAELIGLARNEEAAEKPEHPLNRIVKIEETDEGLVISTTDIHLPRRIAEAVKSAFNRKLDLHFDEGGYFLRADLR